MRKALSRLPSPSMALAFLALLAALAGTAVALPGSNVVTSGDITNGAVRTQDIANSTVRGRDVRNNTLTGSDVDEGSLGTVPRANAANSVNTAGAANAANLAGFAGDVARRTITGQVSAQDGDTDVPVASAAGFRVELECDAGTPTAQVNLENVSAGDNAFFDANLAGDDDDDFDIGDRDDIVTEAGDADDTENGTFSAVAPGGEVLHGSVTVTLADDALSSAPCVATAVLHG